MTGMGHDKLIGCVWMLTSKSAMQALKDMDSNTLKKVLGQASTVCLTIMGDTATLHACAVCAWCHHIPPACKLTRCLLLYLQLKACLAAMSASSSLLRCQLAV